MFQPRDQPSGRCRSTRTGRKLRCMRALTSTRSSARAAELARLQVVQRILGQWSADEIAALDPATLRGIAELRRIRVALVERLDRPEPPPAPNIEPEAGVAVGSAFHPRINRRVDAFPPNRADADRYAAAG